MYLICFELRPHPRKARVEGPETVPWWHQHEEELGEGRTAESSSMANWCSLMLHNEKKRNLLLDIHGEGNGS